MTLDEKIRQIVVDAMRQWPPNIDGRELLKQLDHLAARVKLACAEEGED